MEIGKLPRETLGRLLAAAKTDPSVIIGPAYGEDAAAVKFGGRVLVAASDPVTFTTDRVGYYAVSVNANDIAVTGATPLYFLATILLPEDSSESDAESVFDQITRSCDAIGVTLIGGHTEITHAVDRVVVSGTMLGEADRDSLIRSSGARMGDGIVLAGPAAAQTAFFDPDFGSQLELEEGLALKLSQDSFCPLKDGRTGAQRPGVGSRGEVEQLGFGSPQRCLAGPLVVLGLL